MNEKCIWIVENFSEGEDIFLLIQAVKDADQKLVLIDRKTHFEYKHIQFDNECVVFYGSINMAKIIKDHLKTCAPVVWNDFDAFKCTNIWPAYQQYLFNDKYEFVTLNKLKENKFEYYSKYGKEAMIFIRPDSGEKIFSGQLLDLQDFDKFFENKVRCMAENEDIVVVSTPKNVIGEWRFVVTSEKKIVAKSCYRFHDKITSVPGAPSKAIELVEKILDVGVYPAKIFAIDVAEDSDGNYWMMEFNSFNSSGLYATDKRAIVDEATRLAIEDFIQLKK